MSYISDIRSYFDTQIKMVDATIQDFVEDPLGIEDTGGVDRARYYKLIFGVTNTIKNGSIYQDDTEITLRIFSNTQRAEQTSFDDLYSKSIEIRDCVTDPKLVKNSLVFTEIESSSITPSAIDDNDNAFSIDILFNIRKDYCF